MDYVRNHDPLYECSTNVERELQDVLSCCKIILQEKIRAGTQTTLYCDP
jgi:hypothetical protein